MSSEAIVSNLTAVEDILRQTHQPNLNNIVAEYNVAANQAMVAQRFDLGLERISESASTAFQTQEESRRKTVETAYRDTVRSQDIPEIEVKQFDTTGTVAHDAMKYLESFQTRMTASEQNSPQGVSSVNDGLENSDQKLGEPSTGKLPGGASGASHPPAGQDASVQMLEHAFNYAIEAHIVMNVSQQSQGTLNSLMKGQ